MASTASTLPTPLVSSDPQHQAAKLRDWASSSRFRAARRDPQRRHGRTDVGMGLWGLTSAEPVPKRGRPLPPLLLLLTTPAQMIVFGPPLTLFNWCSVSVFWEHYFCANTHLCNLSAASPLLFWAPFVPPLPPPSSSKKPGTLSYEEMSRA